MTPSGVETPWGKVREPRGRYCWQVSVGGGSLLSLELGAPHLEVVEGRRGGRPYRDVSVRGTWQLTLHECAFVLGAGEREVTEADDLEELRAAARELDGQALLEVVVEGPATRFVFDLGAELRVEPLPELGDEALQWALGKVGGETIGRRGDGRLVQL